VAEELGPSRTFASGGTWVCVLNKSFGVEQPECGVGFGQGFARCTSTEDLAGHGASSTWTWPASWFYVLDRTLADKFSAQCVFLVVALLAEWEMILAERL